MRVSNILFFYFFYLQNPKNPNTFLECWCRAATVYRIVNQLLPLDYLRYYRMCCINTISIFNFYMYLGYHQFRYTATYLIPTHELKGSQFLNSDFSPTLTSTEQHKYYFRNLNYVHTNF